MHEINLGLIGRYAYRRWKPVGLMWIMVLILIGFAGCDSEPVPEPKSDPPAQSAVQYQGTIVAVGNSLTAGAGVDEQDAYPAQLARKLTSDGYKFKVVNAGVSGETSSGALSRIQWVIASLNPDIVILETGANDGLRGIDPAVLQANLDKLLTILKSNHIQIILAGMQMLPNLGPDYIEKFKTIYPQAAQQHETVFMPFFLEGVAGDSELNQADKLHPTAQGYTRIVNNLYPYVLKAIEQWEKRRHN